MRLVADRFAVDENQRAIDLATARPVVLNVGTAGGVSEQLRWTDRCSAFASLHHRVVAPLVDFGLLGEASRFEAWACGEPWRGAKDTATAARVVAARFLEAVGLTTGTLNADAVRIGREGAATLLPDVGAGYPKEKSAPGQATAAATPELPLCQRGVCIVQHPAVAALAEIFHTPSARPYVSQLWGPPGAGKRTIATALAQVARASGFVPVAARLMSSPYAELWRGRSLFIIANEDGAAPSPWSALLEATLREAHPHVLLMVGQEERRSVAGIAIGRVAIGDLVASVRPQPLSGGLEQSARRAAERAHGMRGRFVRLLHADSSAVPHDDRRADRRRLPRVAEQVAEYGVDVPGDGMAALPVATCAWPAPGELAALRRKRDAALAQLAHGRHTSGIRLLRQSVGGLARRGDWSEAATGTVALSTALLRRGRPRDALASIDEARTYAGRAGQEAVLLDLATLVGHAWIDLARLDEAEGALGTAVAAARASRDPLRTAAASDALARCLFWRGHYAEADATLAAAPDEVPPIAKGRRALLGARVALGLRDVPRAMRLVAESTPPDAAGVGSNAKAAVAYTAAFVHMAAGDLAGAQREAETAATAARAADDPLRVVRVRILTAEMQRRSGRTAQARAELGRLRRVMSAMPPLIRARWELSLALTAEHADLHEVVARRAAATGLGALALYATDGRAATDSALVSDPFVEEVVAIVRACQTAEDETTVLRDLCARVRQQLRASAVAFVLMRSGGGDRADVVIGDGARLDTSIAERAVVAGITIAPHRRDDRIEAAAPVQYGGVPIGALCARWTLGSTADTSRARHILDVGAAAAAPVLSAAAIRRERTLVAEVPGLLGVSAPMVELRKNVERAASAPFAVLVDGESGSGKELVARAIHRGGPRRQRPFCTVNCAALPDDLVEAELFGHARGAFTGAVAERAGVFEDAHGGTLFLDEIGELAQRAQAKVLRVIQEGELRRVGENVSRRVDVRLVAATNRDLRREVEAGRFRLDLLYRLDVVHITVPPLRERRDDIALLAEHFWREASARVGGRATLAASTVTSLVRYDWPGNVRELQNVLAALAVRCPKRGVVPPSALPAAFSTSRGEEERWRLDDARRTFEERFVRAALVRTGGHRGRAASELGVTRQGLTKLLTRLGIAVPP